MTVVWTFIVRRADGRGPRRRRVAARGAARPARHRARSKDGCSPQGQCGCCTVLVDGRRAVACVTPARRVAGRDDHDPRRPARRRRRLGRRLLRRRRQPVRLLHARHHRAARGLRGDGAERRRSRPPSTGRCWPTCAAAPAGRRSSRPGTARRRPRRRRPHRSRSRRREPPGRASRAAPAARRPGVALGRGGFADDTAPADALVAVPDGDGGWAVGETLTEARARRPARCRAGAPPSAARPPLDVPPGDWAARCARPGSSPAYLETDAVVVRARRRAGVAAGQRRRVRGKTASAIVGAVARRLADRARPAGAGRCCRARTRCASGPKRPPIAGGVRADGTGVAAGRAARRASPPPSPPSRPGSPSRRSTSPGRRPRRTCGLRAGPRRSCCWPAAARSAGAGALADRGGGGGRASVDGGVAGAGRAAVTRSTRSCCAPTASAPPTWRSAGCAARASPSTTTVRSRDLTIRSFGILRAVDTPPIDVAIDVRRRARRSTAPTPCSPRWRPPAWHRPGLSAGLADRAPTSLTPPPQETHR